MSGKEANTLRKLIALLLLCGGLSLAVIAFLPRAVAMVNGTVGTLTGNTAAYTVSSADGLVWCSVPGTMFITKNIKNNKQSPAITAPLIECQSRFPQAVTLNFTIVDLPTTLTGLAMSGSATLNSTDAGATVCRNLTITGSPNNSNTGTVTFKAASASTTDDFYVELYFRATVTLTGGTTSLGAPGCP